MGVIFEWYGDSIIQRMKHAEMMGVQETAKQIVLLAMTKVRYRDGNLHNSLRVIEPAHEDGSGVSSLVGIDDQPHAAIQELGPQSARNYGYTPYLRPSLDEEGDKLAERIAGNFK